MILTKKQTQALDYLEDDSTNELLFGGGAGGAKSFLGCLWIILSCLKYDGTRHVIGRSKLKNLKETTLVTFFEVASFLGMKSGEHYSYNAQDSTIEVGNSLVILKDLFFFPSDPNFDNLGSLEITSYFIDECNQLNIKAKEILNSRVRYKLSEFDFDGTLTSTLEVAERNEENVPIAWYRSDGSITKGLIPKGLMTCNPAKNWVYTDFYKPSKDGTLPTRRKFIQALATDNPNISPHYIANLKTLPKNSQERLLYGNWEYDDDPSRLMDIEAITDIFTNNFVDEGVGYITADIARLGQDRTVICVWFGFKCIKIVTIDKSTLDEVAKIIEALRLKYNIRKSHTIVDEDGLGGGVKDMLKCKGFINNSRAIKIKGKDVNFANIKAQCYFKLADFVNDGLLYIECNEVEKDLISAELEVVKMRNLDKDTKLNILDKATVKSLIGRSPDFSDAIMMRMYFELSGGGFKTTRTSSLSKR